MNARGVSIVEIIGTMALLGVMGLAALVLVPSVSPARLDAAAKQVVSDIEFAKQSATTTGVLHGVQFIAAGAYTVYKSSTATPLTSPLTHQLVVVTLAATYPGVTLQNSYTVEFNGFGAPITGGGGNVQVMSGLQTRTITVVANTGNVVMQ